MGTDMKVNDRKIRKGAYGVVRIDKDQEKAVKTTALFGSDGFFMSCNLREAVFLGSLVKNPIQGVVGVDSVSISDDGTVESVMELGDYSLHDIVHMNSFRNRINDFFDIFKDVLLGLCAMHDCGVVHGDLKPDNIVRVNKQHNSEFKLVDFGGVCWYRCAPKHTSLCTYVTRAPELFDEKNIPLPVSDAWSLGATMYYYCTRRYLVDDEKVSSADSSDSMTRVAEQHQAGIQVKFPRGVPAKVKEMIRGLLRADPSQRLTCRRCLSEYFSDIYAGEYDGEYDTTAMDDAWRTVALTRELQSCGPTGRQVLDAANVSVKNGDEADCLGVLLQYLVVLTKGGKSAQKITATHIRARVQACHVLARALVYDEDTPLFNIDCMAKAQIIAALRSTSCCSPFDTQYRSPGVTLISIDGNIGASKSTVLQRLRVRLGDAVTCVPEPVDEWKELLTKYYGDPSRWCLALHVKILATFFDACREACAAGKPVLLERSGWSCMAVFEDMLVRNGTMSPEEHSVLTGLFESIKPVVSPDAVVYLKCRPEVCVRRMSKRRRDCETDVGQGYIDDLDAQYESVMQGLHPTKVWTLDTSDLTPDEVENKVFEHVAGLIFPK